MASTADDVLRPLQDIKTNEAQGIVAAWNVLLAPPSHSSLKIVRHHCFLFAIRGRVEGSHEKRAVSDLRANLTEVVLLKGVELLGRRIDEGLLSRVSEHAVGRVIGLGMERVHDSSKHVREASYQLSKETVSGREHALQKKVHQHIAVALDTPACN
jgi:hypothetical protein